MIRKITFDKVCPIWCEHLWPGRVTAIKPTNGLKLLGGYDKQIEEYTPTFFGIFRGYECLGINSGHATSETQYRSRGLYVFPKYRHEGISQRLLQAVEMQGILEGKIILWSMPRKTALPAYEKYGFIQVSDMFDKNMEFGPNCFVTKRIKNG